MRARLHVVVDVANEHAVQSGRVHHDDVIQALAADRADHPLHEGFCQGARGAVRMSRNPHALDAPHELVAVDTVTITEQVGRSRIIRERLDKLPCGPRCRGMVGDVEVDELAAVVAKDDEDATASATEGAGKSRQDKQMGFLTGTAVQWSRCGRPGSVQGEPPWGGRRAASARARQDALASSRSPPWARAISSAPTSGRA
jgi:hypothetical protein